MSDARAEILARVRAALGDVPAVESPLATPDYRRQDDRATDELAALLCARVRDYAADARRVAAAEASRAVAEACREWGLARVLAAPGVPEAWRPEGAIADDGRLAAALDDVDGVITGCAAAIAETGTIVLDGGPASGRRMLTLVPDHHICLVRAEQIVGQVPEAFAALHAAVRERRAPVTFVSGASATSDIELERVEGVHGPRHLLVLIVG